MSYVSLINTFHRIKKQCVISCYATTLYFTLLDICNRLRWVESFEVSTKELVDVTGMTKPTLGKARQELKDAGLIDFDKGANGNKYSKYSILRVNDVYSQNKGDLPSPVKKQRGRVKKIYPIVKEVYPDTLLYNKDIKTTSTDVEVSPADADDVVKSSPKKVVKKKSIEPKAEDPPKPKEKTAPKKKEPPKLVTRAREIFEAYYEREYESAYYWEAKDAVAMKRLLNKISYSREHRPTPLPVDDDSLLDALEKFLTNIEKAWLRDNFSVTNIDSQYNNIISEIKNRSKSLTPNGRYNQTAKAGRTSVGADLSDCDRQRNAIYADIREADLRCLARRQSVSDVTYTEVPSVSDE